jgi:UDP-N-acetyl-D-glucosamine dehydrogenase
MMTVNEMKNAKDTTAAIIGLGYVGLPLAILCKEKGYKVHPIDIDKRKVELIRKGSSPIKGDPQLAKQVLKANLAATTSFEGVAESSVIVICVPTPVDKYHVPDLTPVESACRSILPYIRNCPLIVIESTINPGVCEDIVLPILESTGMKNGKGFDLAHCPERIDPGNRKWNVRNIPRNIGSASKNGLKRGLTFYKSIIAAEINPMATIKEAESTKIVENTFRDINIAYVNELAKSFDKMGINLDNVIKGAASKPFGFMPFYPGCGIGGHCIPVDPYYLIDYAQKKGFNHRLLRLARETNNNMPAYSVEQVVKLLNTLGRSVKGTRVGVYGLAFKENIDDTRESPAYEIIRLLKDMNAEVVRYDPHVPEGSDVASLDEFLGKVEVLVVATAHDEIKGLGPLDLKKRGIVAVFDGRNCLDGDGILERGIAYKGVGR